MSTFLNSLSDKLITLGEEIHALPQVLDSMAKRLDRSKWGSLLDRINNDLNELLDSFTNPNGVFTLPVKFDLQSLSFTPITSEDRVRWRAAHKSEVQVVIGKGRITVMAASEVARKYETTVSQVILAARQEGYIVLTWKQYQKLSSEIGRLIREDEEPGGTTGLLCQP